MKNPVRILLRVLLQSKNKIKSILNTYSLPFVRVSVKRKINQIQFLIFKLPGKSFFVV